MSEVVETLPLTRKRRILGILVPLINMPILGLNIYQTYLQLQAGVSWKSWDFTANALIIIMILVITFVLPYYVPVYQSSYSLEKKGMLFRRFLRRPVEIAYKKIERVELYIRDEGPIEKEVENYAKEASAKLQKVGLKFIDYTNDENNIALIISGKQVFMLSPSKPKSLLKSLKQRAPKMTAKLVELHEKDKTIQELE